MSKEAENCVRNLLTPPLDCLSTREVKKRDVVPRRTEGGQGRASGVAESYRTNTQFGSRLLGGTQNSECILYVGGGEKAEVKNKETMPYCTNTNREIYAAPLSAEARDARDLVQFVALAGFYVEAKFAFEWRIKYSGATAQLGADSPELGVGSSFHIRKEGTIIQLMVCGFRWGALYGVCHITFPIRSITEPWWLKPKLADYKIEAMLPRPKKNIQDEQDEDEEENSIHGSQSGGQISRD
ncbi:hypothetical protein DFH08DRAFT_934484 [Mycena albidolilacea]|uniref:Uncharacterized protein n=1 Tax=Mycena albidolilacea TaxID=1033008 RepID=A0AAD7AAX5_9AGAR|nr:hypothetical protein DFH08DRAFT_934484 [Mycena albidolilacea]